MDMISQMSVFMWLLLGAAVGGVSVPIMGIINPRQQLMNILCGVVGGFLGGWVLGQIEHLGPVFDTMATVFGASVVIGVWHFFRPKCPRCNSRNKPHGSNTFH
jgi:uncharacterized membrane protein YeaQ/YmgE (transglycosylase-associated protein family)